MMISTPRATVRAAWLALAAAACTPAPPATAPAPDAAPKRVRIVHTNDFHGRLLPQAVSQRAAGGSAVLAAHFDSAAARFAGPTVILSAGDDMQGTAISNLSGGRATIEAHNAAGYDAAAFGNHEFDWGQDTLAARVRDSRFPWLAANLFVAGTRGHPAWVRPWVMVERGGVRTAVIGVALQTTPEIVLEGRTAGLEFGPEAPAVDAAAREARAAGADFVVVTAHLGAACESAGSEPEEPSAGCSGEALEMARALTEPVDLVVGGHSHRRVLTMAGSVPFAEAASYSTAYSVTDLERRGGRTAVTHRSIQVPWADQVTPDTQVARIVAAWEARVKPVTGRTVATSAVAFAGRGRGEYPLGNLMADAHRVQTGADASLVNNGAIRRDLPAGPLSWGTMFELQPFQNALVTLRVSGAQLKSALENAVLGAAPDAHISGMAVTWDPAAPAGRRVREIRLSDGRVVADADTITLAVTEFLAGGGDRFTSLMEAPRTATSWIDVDALIAYLQSLPQPVAAPAVGRWRTVP